MKKITFLLTLMLLTLGIGSAWAETGSATITFSNEGLTNSQNVHNKSFALGDYFTVTYTKNSASTNPTYYTSGSAIRCYATKSTTNGNIITIAQTDKGSEVNAYITKVTYSGTHNKKGKTGFTYSGSPTSSDATNANYAAADKVTTATATLKETGGSANGQFYSTGITIEYVYEVSGPPATTYSVTIDSNIEHGTVTADVAEAAEGATVTLTATPAAGYKFGAWDVKDASSNVTVTNNEFTMPASNVTVSASFVAKTQYTIKWNVAEGSVADTKVYEGEALGSLPTAQNCSAGKVFVGWTAATSVSPDGSGITYVKETDVPTVNKEYNAVYATSGGTADKVDELNLTLTGASGTTYSSWSGKKSVSDASYAGSSAGGNSAIQLRSTNNSGIITTASGGKIKKVVVTWNSNTANGRTLNVYGKNTAYTSTSELYTDATAGTLIGTIVNGTSTELDITGDYEYIGMRSNASAMYLDEIEITWSSTSYIDYSLDCGTNNTPFLTVTETAFNFGTVAQNETATETFDVTGGYLAEDVALTLSGTNASFFSVSPATITKADEVNETVTVTYNPTATGDHTATLTIKTGDITKEIALSGKVLAPGKWVLVKDIATLSAGDEIIIAAANADYAIGEAASNNYKGAAITKVGETANADAGVTVLTVEETGVAEVPYAFKAGSNYLYAASSSANQLKGKTTLDVNGQWAVTITAEGVASIVAAKSENRNVMQFNPNNGAPIFACYASASQSALAIYRNSENVVKPVISGDADFTGSTQVTITAQSGLTVYYTTDGSTPDKTATQYNAPFTISATTTVKAIAYDASSNASGVAEMTFTKHDLVNVATAMALEKDEIAYFDEFEVVKVVTGKGNIYIKDASGHGLIYDNTLAGELKDGDRVQGFVGISSPYNGLPEAKPVDGLKVADLTITSGVAAEPYDFTSTAIASTDINKYVVFNDVEIATAVSMSNSNKEFSLTINGSNVAFYNQFSIEKTLEAGKTYDIYGFVSIYNEKLQVYFYQALEEDEVVTKYTVTYNAGGAIGEVPVDDNEYTKGAQVYLKSATGLTREGYDYKGWKVTDEGGNEITVSSNKFNMPASNVTVTAQWEEIVVTPRQDFSSGYWVLVTDASELTAGDKIMITAAEENFAMKSYESGNNCGQIEITKLGEGKFVKWISEVGVFELAANGSNYTIQDVNTKDYLYAAGSGENNYLKAADEVPTDENQAKYLWTISFTDGVPTVKATSVNRNTLMYNTGSNLFACYASGQKAIALYKYVTSVEATKVTPSVVENAYFSVADGEFVQFSTGNLQYEVGTNTWSFASDQYEVIGGEAYTGSNNTNYGMNEPGYTGKLDLFAWSCDGKFGVNPSNADADYTGEFADWGKLVNEEGWYTLTKDEMNYLLNRKKDGKKLWALATVCGMNGLILLPDNWNKETELEYGYVPADWNYTKNQFDDAAWAALEAAGAVFLPEGGSRTGGYGNKESAGGSGTFNADGDYFHVDNVNIYGYYWLNTQDTRPAYPHCASYLILPGWSEGATNADNDDICLQPQVWSREKRRGNSVRLVKKVTPYTRTVTSGDYGTICLPNGGLLLGASAFSVAKMEGTTILLDEVGTTMVGGTPYVVFPNTGATNLYVFYTDNVEAPAGEENGLYGSYERRELDANAGYYIMLPGNKYAEVTGDRVYVGENRAYFKVSEIPTTAPAPAPGVRRIAIGQAPQVATGMENIDASAQPVKTIINGQLFILRGEKMYDAQGKLVK